MKTVLIGDWKKDMCVVPSVQQIQINYPDFELRHILKQYR